MKKTNHERSRIYQIDLDPRAENDARIIASKYIPSNSIVLDVGSACGDLGLMLHKQKNCEVYGMEFNYESIEIAKNTKAYSKIHQVDLNNFNELDYENYYGYFDCIVLLDVLEHILSPNEVLLKLVKLLKKDGSFVISLPNVAFGNIKLQLLTNHFDYTETGILDKTHVKFFTYRTIATLLSDAMFEVLDCTAKVADVSFSGFKVPSCVKKYIRKDPQSFVYQYVLKAKPVSARESEDIAQINLNKMFINWSQINNQLRKLQRHSLIDSTFPPGSCRRDFAKKLHSIFKGLCK